MYNQNSIKDRIAAAREFDANSFLELYRSSAIIKYSTIAVVSVVGVYALGAFSGALAYAIRNVNQLSRAANGAVNK